MSNTNHTGLETIKSWMHPNGAIIMHGMPQAGKDSQGRRLAELVGSEFFSSGQIFRDHESELPEEIQNEMHHGQLVETEKDSTFDSLVLGHISSEEFIGRSLILSGVGRRSESEAIRTMNALTRSGHLLRAVVSLNVDMGEIRRRHSNGRTDGNGNKRKDDTPDAFENRLVAYEQETVLVLDFYQQRGLLVPIDANGTIAEVSSRIIDELAEYFSGQ